MLSIAVRVCAVACLTFGLAFASPRLGAQEEAPGVNVAATPVAEPDMAVPVDGEDLIEPAGEVPGDPPVGGNVLVSNTGDADPNNDAGSISFTGGFPATGVDFANIDVLSANLDYSDGDSCAVGSPRFAVVTAQGNLFVYIGPAPSFTGCTDGDTGNLIGAGDARFDLTQFGGAFYSTYAQAVAALDGIPVTGIALVVDGGYAFPDQSQIVTVVGAVVDVAQINEFSDLTVVKTLDTTSGPAVGGACFSIFAPATGAGGGELLYEEACDADRNGEVLFESVPAYQEIVVVETTAPDGYVAGPDLPVRLEEGPQRIVFPNSLGFGTLQILKYDCVIQSGDDDVAGVVFAVADPGDPAAATPGAGCGPIGAGFEIWPFGDESSSIPVTVDASGSLIVPNIPVTNATPHLLVEVGTGGSGAFASGDEVTTIVQVFNNEPDVDPDPVTPVPTEDVGQNPTPVPTEVPTQAPTQAPSATDTPVVSARPTSTASVTTLPSTGAGSDGGVGLMLPFATLLVLVGAGSVAWAVRRRVA